MTQMGTTSAMTTDMQQCIALCNDTHSACEQAMTHALRSGGKMAERDVIMLLMDCAEMSRTAADMMMRQSMMAPQMCRLCADACMACAEMCDRFPDDAMMRDCAQMCRRSAEMCMRMAGARM
jgi:hypothetical protein